MSYKQYRTLDLFIFCLMYVVFEFITTKAATVWFDEPYSISIMLPILLIVMMRWGEFVIFEAVIAAVSFVIMHGGSFPQLVIYTIGNLGFMLTLVYLLKIGKERVRESFVLSEVFAIVGFLTTQIFRGLVAMLILKAPAVIISEFILTDMLSLVFTLVVIFVVRRVEDLFVDQKEYLLRIHNEEKAKKENDEISY